MPLTLVATPGASEANAYATVAEALAHAEYRVGGAAFVALTTDQQIQTLVTAARDIDTLEHDPGFLGDRATETQALAWPRTGTDYDDDELPAALVQANIELAMSYAPAFVAGFTGDVLNQNRTDGQVKRKKVDVLETEWFAPRTTEATALERFPDAVQRLLVALVVVVADSWGSAVVDRGS